MPKVLYRLLFKHLFFISIIGLIQCNWQFTQESPDSIIFTVADVGQGLSQIAVTNDSVVVFDMGPFAQKKKWFNAYFTLGSLPISAIFISHSDLDHSGGLQFIDDTISWTGTLITGCHEDTSLLRKQCLKWNQSLQILTLCQDDTLQMGTLRIFCLWPPRTIPDDHPVSESYDNLYSLVLLLVFKNTSVLLTGDIETSGLSSLCQIYGYSLKSDIVIVPHHGSKGSINQLFYAYAKPFFAIVSAGVKNNYGHPARETIEMLGKLGIPYKNTATVGTISLQSNGFYWNFIDN